MFDFIKNSHALKLLAQLLALHLYLYLLLFEFYGGRIATDYFVLLGYSVLLDMFLFYLVFKKIKLNPMSAMVTGTAIFILVTTHLTVIPYLVAATVGLSAKYIFRFPKGHVFNPACLGLLFVVFLMPEQSQALLKQWTSGPIHFVIVYASGLSVAYLARRHVISITYFSVLAALSFIYGLFFSEIPALNVVGPIFGFSIVVYAFHMITDPATSPRDYPSQAIMGASIALLDFLFRRFEQPYAPFMALMLISAARPILGQFGLKHKWSKNNEAQISLS